MLILRNTVNVQKDCNVYASKITCEVIIFLFLHS